MTRPILYDYWRSSACYRVRIGLNLKGIDYERRTVNLLESEQSSAEYRDVNPQGLVPLLEVDGQKLTQSLAILGYLDQRFPNSPFLPTAALDRARVVSMAMVVACDIHPINNLRVLRYLKGEMGQPQDSIDAWYRHWIRDGLPALEAMAAETAGRFLYGDAPTGADICLIPQLYNARRYDIPLDDYPTLLRAEENANKIEAFAAAAPERQEGSA